MNKTGLLTIVLLLLPARYVLAQDSADLRPPVASGRSVFDHPTCGPAAIALILKMYSVPFDTDSVCNSCYVDTQRRSSVKSICDTFAQYGIYARGCTVSFSELKERPTPSILLSKNARGNNHFLVCVGHEGDRLKLIDPLFTPFKKLSRETFEKSKQKVAIVTQLDPFSNYESRKGHFETLLLCSSVFVFAVSGLSVFVWPIRNT